MIKTWSLALVMLATAYPTFADMQDINTTSGGIRGNIVGKIEYVQVNVGTNYGVVKFDQVSESRPSCATDPEGRMIFSLDGSGGKALLSMALAAKASIATVSIYGTGSCNGALELVEFARYH